MSVLDAILLGVIQGLAEFLPISSSGHILLFEKLFSIEINPNAMMLLTVLLHVGTLVSVFIVFFDDWMQILKHFFRSKTLGLLFIASLPALFVKILLGDAFDALNKGGLMGFFFMVTALMLFITEKLSSLGKHAQQPEAKITVKNALAMGGMQALGMFSGVSRSGSTILGGIMTGLPRYAAAKFSFMMSAPAIVGGLLVEGKAAIEGGAMEYLSLNILPVVAGMVAAGISGYLAIHYMLKLINRISFNKFALYMLLLGLITIALQIAGVGTLPPLGV